jgi:hypothetical protein
MDLGLDVDGGDGGFDLEGVDWGGSEGGTYEAERPSLDSFEPT